MTIITESAAQDPVRASLAAFLEAAAGSDSPYAMRDLHRMLVEEAVFGFLNEKAMSDEAVWKKRTEVAPRPAADEEQARKRAAQNAKVRAELGKKTMKESAFHSDEEKDALCARIDAWAAENGVEPEPAA
jgi:hypothetical protein